MKRICATLVMVLAVLGGARAQGVEEQIKKLEQERLQAVAKGDVDTLAKMTGDDYVLINIRGQMLDKAQTLDQIKSGQIKIQSNEQSDIKVRVYGNTAVVTGKSTVKGVISGTEVNRQQLAFTRVYVKKGGKWQSVSFQQTKVE